MIIAWHINDLLYGGIEQFQLNVIEKLHHILKFGTANGAFTYIRMNVKQHADFSITLDQVSFAKSISPLELPPDRLLAKNAPLTDKEWSHYRVAVGQLNWLAGISHPEISFDVCQASAKIKSATVADIVDINKVIYKVNKEGAYIVFPKLDLESVHLRVYTDGGSQGGHLVLLADVSGSCSPLSWISSKIKRVVHSTLAVETLALNDGCDSAFYMSKLICNIMSSGNSLLRIIAVTDNQSATDAIHSTSLVSDK